MGLILVQDLIAQVSKISFSFLPIISFQQTIIIVVHNIFWSMIKINHVRYVYCVFNLGLLAWMKTFYFYLANLGLQGNWTYGLAELETKFIMDVN
jgi:hypothetical protein